MPAAKVPDKGVWLRSSICVWEGPSWLRKTRCLKDVYPADLDPFFCYTLRIRTANWKTIMDEAKCMDPSDDIRYISEVFKAINTCLEGTVYPEARAEIVEHLKDAQIFPIHTGRSGSVFDYMSSARDLDLWFIADRWHLKKSFEGIDEVPLLALDVDVIEKISLTITLLGLGDRLLSQAAGATAKSSGPTQLHEIFTSSLRAKARHIAR